MTKTIGRSLLCLVVLLIACGDDQKNISGTQSGLETLAGLWEEQNLGTGDSGTLVIFSAGRYTLDTIDLVDPDDQVNSDIITQHSDGPIRVNDESLKIQFQGDLNIVVDYELDGNTLSIFWDGNVSVYQRKVVG